MFLKVADCTDPNFFNISNFRLTAAKGKFKAHSCTGRKMPYKILNSQMAAMLFSEKLGKGIPRRYKTDASKKVTK